MIPFENQPKKYSKFVLKKERDDVILFFLFLFSCEKHRWGSEVMNRLFLTIVCSNECHLLYLFLTKSVIGIELRGTGFKDRGRSTRTLAKLKIL